MTENALFSPLTLPNGRVLRNRLCKAAMEENLSDWGQVPGKQLHQLYGFWGQGGLGLILTGNVMVSPDAMTGPGGVVLQTGSDLTPFTSWANEAKRDGAMIWMQISHPGRQVYAAMGEQAVSASDKGVEIEGFSHLFAQPRALSEDEIKALVLRFATTAGLAEQAGFDGCQIHAAHGYLISQFLSPLTNNRSDSYGGTLINRARFLMEVVGAVRAQVSSDFCVSVKLNSADFQKGGFELEDAKAVVSMLNQAGVDLVELSGGSYESPAMQGRVSESSSSTVRREAYFIDFAREIASVASMPIMVTGGITRLETAKAALIQDAQGFGVSMLGIARALALEPRLAQKWQSRSREQVSLPQVQWRNKTLAALATMALTKAQLQRMAAGKAPKEGLNPVFALLRDRWLTWRRTQRYRRWREGG